MTALQILIWRPCDHAVSCDYTVTTLDAENKRSPTWRICRHRWHRNLSSWLTMPPVTILSSWRSFAFSENTSRQLHDDSLKKVTTILLKMCIKQLHRYMSRFHVHTWSQFQHISELFICSYKSSIKELQYTYQMFRIIRTKHSHITCMYSHCFLYNIICG